MAHPNIDLRRRAVRQAALYGTPSKSQQIELASRFGCSISAIRADLKKLSDRKPAISELGMIRAKTLMDALKDLPPDTEVSFVLTDSGTRHLQIYTGHPPYHRLPAAGELLPVAEPCEIRFGPTSPSEV